MRTTEVDDYRTRGKSHDNVAFGKEAVYRRPYDTDPSPDDDEDFSISYQPIEAIQRSLSAVDGGKRFVSENNVQYETIGHRSVAGVAAPDARRRRPNSSGSELFGEYSHGGPPLQLQGIYKKSGGAPSMKEYKRFYGTSAEDTGDDDGPKRSSDESSLSPNGKSLLNSPDTVVPLLQSPMGTSSPTRRSRIPISISASQYSRRLAQHIDIAY